MFDPESSSLLRSAPSVEDIDAEDLPRLLTEIYTQLVTERVRGINSDDTLGLIERLAQIGNRYESIAVTGDDPEISRASAFVAGSAYQIMAKTLSNLEGESENDNVLTRDHISGDIAAALLFLISQQLPDAHEAIQRFKGVAQTEPLIIQELSDALMDLVKENFGSILERASMRKQAPFQQNEELIVTDQATTHLYEKILEGIVQLSAVILSKPLQQTDSLAIFRQVIALSTREYAIPELQSVFLSTYPGPAHLATLLLNLGQRMIDSSILLLPVPSGSDEIKWRGWLNFRALKKPLLWLNHQIALKKNFHAPGQSAILVLPTGAGKTTISEFKIAATLSAGKRVVFLAPTNALVDQLRRDLAVSLPGKIFDLDTDYDADLLTTIKGALPGLTVMTPEKCLAVLNFNPAAFDEVGLVIFDECHSLSAEAGSLRRALDGMLVILRLTPLLPELDFLFLSAMIQDPQTFAEWISQLTTKNCFPIDLLWKPSRQARGVVVYPSQQIDEIEAASTSHQHELDRQAVAKGKTLSKGLQTAAGKQLYAVPYALFGLVSNWHPDRPNDICIRKLSDDAIELNHEFSSSRIVHAKSNGNEVSKQIGIAAANGGLKTIIFMNNTGWVNKYARESGQKLAYQVQYNEHESKLFAAIETEFGQPECSVMHNLLRCVPHHADLLPFERQLAESLYRREDGARIIFATTTLSQGMNLPAQVAILSANERASLGGTYVTQEPMKAHELLNAAGRAGRAGFLANGLVILVPRDLLRFSGTIPEANAQGVLKSIIPQDERCVPIIDPLEKILDHLQKGLQPDEDSIYLFYRLGLNQNAGSVEGMLKRSLGYFMAAKAGEVANFEAAISAISKQIDKISRDIKLPDWLIQLSIQSGIDPKILGSLYSSLAENLDHLPSTLSDWASWLLSWLGQHPEAGRFCFGNDFQPLQTIGGAASLNATNYQPILEVLKHGLLVWMRGETLVEVERAMGGNLTGQKIICPKARELATNVAPRCLSYFSTFIVQIVKKLAEDNAITPDYLAVLEAIPSAISQGVDTPEKLAFMNRTRSRYRSRVEAHKSFITRFGELVLPHNISYVALDQMVFGLLG